MDKKTVSLIKGYMDKARKKLGVVYFKIADITFRFSGYPLKPDSVYRKFLSPACNHDFSLNYSQVDKLPSVSGRLIFNFDDHWQIYKGNGNLIIQDGFNTVSEQPERICVLKERLNHAEIYTLANSRFCSKNPLSFPIGPIMFLHVIARHSGVILHACSVKERTGKALIFCGCSGSGKTTLAKLFQQRGIITLHDDWTIVRKIDKDFVAYGIPGYASSRFVHNESGPVEKIFFLRHGKTNSLKQLTPESALKHLIIHSFCCGWDKNRLKRTLDILQELASRCKFYQLSFMPNESVFDIVATGKLK